jgi:hypothetical protein
VENSGNDYGNDHATPRNCCNYRSNSRDNQHGNDGGIESTINSFMVIMAACGGIESPKYYSLIMLPYQVYHGLLGYGFMTFLGTARMPTASFQKDSLLSESSSGSVQSQRTYKQILSSSKLT